MKLNGRQALSITIQQATINNLEILYQIERECFTIEAFSKQHIAYLLENPNAVSLVAKINNAIAGFIIGLIHCHDKKITSRVYSLDVAVKYRRKGVGLKLLNEIERIFVKRGVKICYLEVRKGNVAALELYRKNGYVEVEELKYYYNGAHGVRLEKKLGA
jgi:ribosomal-protein-alanine N-acetyltransferase